MGSNGEDMRCADQLLDLSRQVGAKAFRPAHRVHHERHRPIDTIIFHIFVGPFVLTLALEIRVLQIELVRLHQRTDAREVIRRRIPRCRRADKVSRMRGERMGEGRPEDGSLKHVQRHHAWRGELRLAQVALEEGDASVARGEAVQEGPRECAFPAALWSLDERYRWISWVRI